MVVKITVKAVHSDAHNVKSKKIKQSIAYNAMRDLIELERVIIFLKTYFIKLLDGHCTPCQPECINCHHR